jgi:putative endonuclease
MDSRSITGEKEIKGWCRNKKMELIKTINSHLSFLNYLFE